MKFWMWPQAFVPVLMMIVPSPVSSSEFNQTYRVVTLMNLERHKAGLAPLSVNPNLERAARNYATTMAQLDPRSRLSHSLNGKDPGMRARAAGYRWRAVGENIAYNYAHAQPAMDEWMRSPPHRQNILNPRYREVGVAARANSRGQLYWAVSFGRR